MRKPSRIDEIRALCDSRTLFDTPQAARFLGLTEDAVRQSVTRKHLRPAKIRRQLFFTRSDLEAFKSTAKQARIVRGLQAGELPIDIYLSDPHGLTLRDVEQASREWSRVTGYWIVEGPPGSYARWLVRMGLVRLTPRQLRRVIEGLLLDPDVARKAALTLASWRVPTDAKK